MRRKLKRIQLLRRIFICLPTGGHKWEDQEAGFGAVYQDDSGEYHCELDEGGGTTFDMKQCVKCYHTVIED